MRDPQSLTGSFPAFSRAVPLSPDGLWRSLGLFNLYRLTLSGLFLLLPVLFGDVLAMSAREQSRFFWVAAIYTVLVLLSVLMVSLRTLRAKLQLSFQIYTDIVAVALLTYFSGGVQNNLGMLLLVSLALGGLVSRGRITLLYAALASIAMLSEHAYSVLFGDAVGGQFLQAGMLSASYFAVAWLAHTLSKYALASERLAFRRGVDLSNMAEANRLMIQDMPDGVLVVDERGVVRQSNPGAERLLRFVFQPNSRVRLVDCSPLLAVSYAAWRQNPTRETEEMRLSGSSRTVRVRFLPVQREGFWGAVVVLEDMQRQQELAQQGKLAALGRLTANIAHEVRNPLSAISYATELLREQEHAPAQERLFQIILDNSARLNRIVQDVMQINRRDRLHAERFDLAQRLRELIGDLCQVEQVDAAVVTLALSEQEIEFDRGHFEQVIWNLCRNALNFCQRKSGSVHLRSFLNDEGRVALEIEDDGPGVPAEMVQNLFEPFFTTSKGGTGLGLYIARELCEANGAKIRYRDAGGGACFRIVFGERG